MGHVWTILAIAAVVFFWKGVFGILETQRSTHNSRRHFGRPSFRMWVDKEGQLHVEGGQDLDHSTRCQNSLRDWYDPKEKLLFYVSAFVSDALTVSVFYGLAALIIWALS
jgi:hypothetical protein